MSKVTLLAIVVLLNSCGSEQREPEPVPIVAQPPKQTRPQKCAHLYNVGRHTDWADCMGVGYK